MLCFKPLGDSGCYTEKDDIKQIDRKTAKRIRWLAYAPAIAGVIVFIIACIARRILFGEIAIGLMWLGVTLYIIALTYHCIRQKCYGQLAVSLIMFVLAVVTFILISDDSLFTPTQ